MNLSISMPRLSRLQRNLWTVTAIFLLSICAGVTGLMTRTVAAQTASPSAQGPQAAGKQQTAPDLACTYYGKLTVAHAGTCGYDKNDKKKYVCYLNPDMAQSEPQTGCEWKLRRAAESKK